MAAKGKESDADRNDGKRYERAAEAFFRKKYGHRFEVKRDVKLPNAHQGKEQIDVLLTAPLGSDFLFTVGIEAKDYGRTLTKKDVRDIVGKFSDAGVHEGIIVCTKGLQRGADQLCSTSSNPRIRLEIRTLEELIGGAWSVDFLDAIHELDEAKANEDPATHTIDKVVLAIEAFEHYARYFFHDLLNPHWIRALSERKVFARSARGTTAISPFLVAGYLAKFAEHYEAETLQFYSCFEKPSYGLENDLFQLAPSMSHSAMCELVKIASRWPLTNLYDGERVAKLVEALVHKEEVTLAQSLLNRLLTCHPIRREGAFGTSLVDVTPEIDTYLYYEVIANLLPTLCEINCPAFLPYVSSKFTEFFKTSNDGSDFGLDYSTRSDIGTLDHFGIMDGDNAWVEGYRKGIEKALQKNEAACREHLAVVLSAPPTRAHLRILAYILDHHFEKLKAEYLLLLETDIFWTDYYATKEVQQMVTTNWMHMSPDAQASTLRRILEPPRFDLPHLTADEMNDRRDRHIVDWLLVLKDLNLGEDVAERRHQLVEKTGHTTPNPRQGIVGGYANPIPTETENFQDWDATQIISYIQTFKARGDFLERKTPSGVSRKLREVISIRPVDFLDLLQDLHLLPFPTYYSAILEGYADALRASRVFDTKAVVDYAQVVYSISQTTDDILDRDDFDFGSFSWLRRAVLDLLNEIAQSEEAPIHVLDRCCSLAKALALDVLVSEPSREPDRDWMNAVINSDAGLLGQFFGRLAENFLRRSYGSDRGLSPVEAKARFNEILTYIEDHLIPAVSDLVRAPLGLYYTVFYVGNENWALQNLSQIFDRRDHHRLQRWSSTWDCHFWRQSRYESVFESLRDEYFFALTHESLPSSNWKNNLAGDVALFWMAGNITIDDRIWIAFMENATPDMKKTGNGYIGRALHQARENPDAPFSSHAWPRAKLWWDLLTASRNVNPSDDESNFEDTFLLWLPHVPNKVTALEVEVLLVRAVTSRQRYFREQIYDFLSDRVDLEPDSCARIVAAMCAGEPKYFSRLHEGKFKGLIRSAFQAGNESSKVLVKQGVNNLLAAGHFQYRDALPTT